MGITFRCGDDEINTGYSHFKFFRDKLAIKVCGEFYDLYVEPERKGAYFMLGNSKQEYFQDHAKRCLALCKRLKVPKKFMYFLWTCDCEGKCTPSQSRFVLRYAQKFTSEERNIMFGYATSGKTIQDFLNMFEESVKLNKPITWS